MQEKLESISSAFGKKLVGGELMQRAVCEVVALMPEEIITFVTSNCWFVGSLDDAWAFTFTGNDIRGQHLIFLSDELMLQNSQQIHWSIAHEIGHVMLNHRNAILRPQTTEEIAIQEREADEFASQYIGDHDFQG